MMDRRKFLTILGATVAAATTQGAWLRPGSARAAETMAMGAAQTGVAEAYTFFTDPEVAFVKAAVARLIPADELGPGGVEADVPFFIDQQLSGAYGAGAHFYNQGPFGSETPFQGYQLPLSPAELYRVGIAATDKYCQETYGEHFAALDPARQDEVLSGLQGIANAVDLKDIPGTTFFARLLGDTMDGFFADPAYGGNKDMIGWKLVGFPGVKADYSEALARHNQPYQAEPAGLRSLQQVELTPAPAAAPEQRKADATPQPSEPAYAWNAGQRFFV
jgi:gluconate 2-dehydrogenase gamma chain